MKTVTGTVLSSKPVSISKAAKALSVFSSADNGASPAVAAYLKLASESFDELVRLHRELKGLSSQRSTRKKPYSGNVDADSNNNNDDNKRKKHRVGNQLEEQNKFKQPIAKQKY